MRSYHITRHHRGPGMDDTAWCGETIPCADAVDAKAFGTIDSALWNVLEHERGSLACQACLTEVRNRVNLSLEKSRLYYKAEAARTGTVKGA